MFFTLPAGMYVSSKVFEIGVLSYTINTRYRVQNKTMPLMFMKDTGFLNNKLLGNKIYLYINV